MEAAVEFKHPLFQLERNTKHNGRIFTRYPVNASENGDFNRGRKSFQANTMLKNFTRATEKTKRSWIYMRENGVDSPYLFLHCVFSKGVASTFEVVRPGSRSGLLWVCQKVGVVSFCCRLHVLFYF